MTTPRHGLRAPLTLTLLSLAAGHAAATNGMNMEGYGPVSTGMGGASQAIDHGTAAMAQNPATLALMGPGARLDVALGVLGPDVKSEAGPFSAKSSGTSYLMPAFGYARRSGDLTYGLGVFAQGGMGTDYSASSFLANPTGTPTGGPVRSELGVGRLLLPVAFQVTPEFAVGGSLDFVWASLDLRMALPGALLQPAPNGLVTGGGGALGMGLASLPALPEWARVDFSNSSDFSGAAKATGWGAKLGVVYKASPEVTLGASYQVKTSLSDMKTGGSGAKLSMCMATAPDGSCAMLIADTGKIKVQDFQWPAMLAVGGAWQATPSLLLAMDIKRIQWSDVMESFKMVYQTAGSGMFPDGSVSFALPQNWKDQTVTSLGLAWAASDAVVLRAGLNLASNPIPEALVNPLFPATEKRHYTAGLGWQLSPAGALNASLTVAPTTTVVNGMGVKVTHSQRNLQVMYSHRF